MAVVRTQSIRPAPRRAIQTFSRMAPLSTRGWRPFSRVVANTELKVQDLPVATYNVSTTSTPASGGITLLAVPVTGADFNARIGRKIKLKSLYIRGRVGIEDAFSTTANTTVRAQQVRMIIVYDLQPNGAAPAITDILNTADPASHLQLNFRDRFRVIADKEWTFDIMQFAIGTSAWNRTIYNVKLYKKLNLDMIFNAVNGGTVADIASGALYMVWIGSNPTAADTDINFIGSTRVRYADA